MMAARRRSFASNKEALTFTLSGLSKISGTAADESRMDRGVRAGADDALARLEVVADTYLSLNAPTQWAVPTLLAQRKPVQAQLVRRLLKNLSELDGQLVNQKVCERLQVEGGWCATLRVPATRSDEDLAIALLRERSVLVHPGHFYDFPGDGYLVLSLITPEEQFQEGVRRLLEFFASADLG